MKVLQSLTSAAVAAAMVSMTAFTAVGQTSASVDQSVVAENAEFNPHFFLQLQAGAGYTVGEARSFGDLVSPAAAINVGYRFSPLFGLRLGASGWEAKGSWVNPRHDYKFNYLQGNLDAMLSLSNLFCGSNPVRTLDFYAFAGVGVACGFNNDEANDLAASGCCFEKLWSGKKVFPAGRLGLGMDINLSRCFAINVEVNTNILPDKFNSKRGDNVDWQFNALAGITYNFGGRYKKVAPVVDVVVVEEPAPEPLPQPTPVVEPAPEPVKPVVKEFKPMTQDIFFRINSSTISAEEQKKVDELIEYLKENPEAKVTVTGYADKKTGSAAYNMKISKARAYSVADALSRAGIPAQRIITEAKGDTEQPFDVNAQNRVAIAITHK